MKPSEWIVGRVEVIAEQVRTYKRRDRITGHVIMPPVLGGPGYSDWLFREALLDYLDATGNTDVPAHIEPMAVVSSADPEGGAS